MPANFAYAKSQPGIIKLVEIALILLCWAIGFGVMSHFWDGASSILMFVLFMINVVFVCLHLFCTWSSPCLEFIHAIVGFVASLLAASFYGAGIHRCESVRNECIFKCFPKEKGECLFAGTTPAGYSPTILWCSNLCPWFYVLCILCVAIAVLFGIDACCLNKARNGGCADAGIGDGIIAAT